MQHAKPIILNSSHIPQMVDLHLEELPGDFCSLLGRDFLTKAYYPYFFAKKDCFAVGILEDLELLGFISFVEDDFSLIEVVLRNFNLFIFNVFKQGIRIIPYFFTVAILLFLKPFIVPKGYELAFAMVKNKVHGKNMGTRIMQASLPLLASKNCRYLWVKTMQYSRSVDFYQRFGFVRIACIVGRVFLQKDMQVFLQVDIMPELSI